MLNDFVMLFGLAGWLFYLNHRLALAALKSLTGRPATFRMTAGFTDLHFLTADGRVFKYGYARTALLGGYVLEVEGRAADREQRAHALAVTVAGRGLHVVAATRWMRRSDPLPPPVVAVGKATAGVG